MNTLLVILDAAAAARPAAGQSSWSMWLMLILIFVVMWLFMIRPQRKQQKELENFRNSLEKGTKVITAGGIYGKVVEIQERTLLIEVDNNVKIKVEKTSVMKDPADVQPAK